MNRAILVKSCQRFRARREACEATWVDALRAKGVGIWFIEGGHTALRRLREHEVNPRVSSDKFVAYPRCWPDRGVIQSVCGDEYRDNSLKLKNGLAFNYCMTESDFPTFIVDDDTFVHPERWLAHEPAGEFECRLYQPRLESEWHLSQGRPWAQGGAGWYMSRRLCELYVEQVTERCSWDDVLASQVAQRARVKISDRPDLYGGDRYSGHNDRVAADNTLITCHHVQPAEMHTLYEATRGL